MNNRQHFKNEIKPLLCSLKNYNTEESITEVSYELLLLLHYSNAALLQFYFDTLQESGKTDLSNLTSKLTIQAEQCLHQYEDLKLMLTAVESSLVNYTVKSQHI